MTIPEPGTFDPWTYHAPLNLSLRHFQFAPYCPKCGYRAGGHVQHTGKLSSAGSWEVFWECPNYGPKTPTERLADMAEELED